MFAVVLGGLVLLYHATKQFVSARANLVDGFGMVCQVFWELGQTMAVISQMTIDWPEEAQDILAFAKFLIFDMDDFGLRWFTTWISDRLLLCVCRDVFPSGVSLAASGLACLPILEGRMAVEIFSHSIADGSGVDDGIQHHQ